jgi:integrase
LLATRRHDPNGDPLPATAHVFGNEIGGKIDSVKSAWRGTCRRAGIADLTFHDLRRTAGSRFLQYGVPLHDVRDQLGHASVAQTDTYLNGTRETRRTAVLRAERKRLGLPAAEAAG